MMSYILLFFICLFEKKIGLLGWLLFLLSLFWSFSLTILLIVTFIISIYGFSVIIRNTKQSETMVLLVIPMVLIFAIFGTDALNYVLLKFNNVQSGNPAIYLIPEWHPIIAGANFDGLSPFGSRGVYDPTDVNLFVLLAYAGLGVFAISQLALLLLDHLSLKFNADRFIKISILTTIILFSLKSPAFAISSWYTLMALMAANFIGDMNPKKTKKL